MVAITHKRADSSRKGTLHDLHANDARDSCLFQRHDTELEWGPQCERVR
jgi:hypothetical protein